MGSTLQSQSAALQEDECLENSIPSYYVKNPVFDQTEIDAAASAWRIIVNGIETTPFIEKKTNEIDFYHPSTSTWFYEIFYDTFFLRCPEVVPLFSNVGKVSRGKLIAAVLSLALEVLENPEKVRQNLSELAHRHNIIGVEPFYYGIMGDALFNALQEVLGPSFDELTRRSWIKLYSYMLSIILPIAVQHKCSHNTNEKI